MRVLVIRQVPYLADVVANTLYEAYGIQSVPIYKPFEIEETLAMFNFDVAVVDWPELLGQVFKRGDSQRPPDALDIGLQIKTSQPHCRVILYREQVPNCEGLEPLEILECFKHEGIAFETLSTGDSYRTLFDLVRGAEIPQAH